MDFAFWHFSNNTTNYNPVADSMNFIRILNYTCTGPFLGALRLLVCYFWILVWGKNIYLICCVLLVMRCRMHINIYGGSFLFFYIISLRLDVTQCNLRIVWFFSLFILLDLSVPPPVSSVPLALLRQCL